MFERPHHARIARVLEALDASLLLRNRCLFGGGTAIALALGEYRESVDIDFICSSLDGYRELRGLVSDAGMHALFTTPIALLREARIDQYGIRCALAVDAMPVKFEIVFEARVDLADPVPADKICGVWALTYEDRTATKLMANSDRWADDSVMSRDMIDLTMLAREDVLEGAGCAKAVRAYGRSIGADFRKARSALLSRPGRLQACMRALSMPMPLSQLRLRLEALSLKLA